MPRRPPKQPAKADLVMAGITNRQVAQAVPCSDYWASRVLNGYVRPPERFRKAVAAMLGKPEAELFYDWDSEPAGART
jgi:hypothetical protein